MAKADSTSRACEICAAPILKLKPDRANRFCSRACLYVDKANRRTASVVCRGCDKRFFVPPSRTHYGFCSAPCRKAFHADPLRKLLKRCVKDEASGCWLWVSQSGEGYGHLRIDGKSRSAHHASYELHVGPIPDGMRVLHRCDNPRCINPEHLFLGTQADNVADMVAKGRGWWQRGKAHSGAE